MGNVVQCCPTFLNYFKCSQALVQGELERSLLLSSEESECESPSLPEVTEEGLLPGSSNLTLEPENFLFPDIVLSSNLGGDVTLVEPMVCLLVSEEDDGTGVGEPGKEALGGGSRGCYEVETQTGVEMHNGVGLQTQTEVQGHSEVVTERGGKGVAKSRIASEDICEGPETMKEVETEAQQHPQLKLNTEVTLFPETNTHFAQQENSIFKFAGCEDGSLGQKVVQTKSRNLSERQTADQMKGSDILHQSKTTGARTGTGLFQVEEDGAGMGSMALFSLDRLFLMGQRHKSRWIYLFLLQ